MTVRDLTSQIRNATRAWMRLSYSIYEAKAKLSELLRTVREGKRVTITDRGRAVARVVPIADDEDLDQRLADLTAAGILSGPVSAPFPGPEHGVSRPGALDRLLQERE